jgi:starch synthase
VLTYFVGNDRYFGRDGVYGFPDDVERYLFFCRAVLATPERLGWIPDVVHTNDWHTAIIPHWMKGAQDLPQWVRRAASVLTIHNLAYQGGFDPDAFPAWIDPTSLQQRENGSYDLLTQGISGADILTTVSERYAHEITTPEYGEGLDGLLATRQARLRGIINGIDYEVFDPATDPAIAQHFSVDDPTGKAACKEALQREEGFDIAPTAPLIGLIGRLADQKGFDLVAAILEPFLAEIDAQVVVLGTGEPRYHDLFRELAAHNRRQLAVHLTFDAALAQRIYAGADLFLMPSRFEPCGLGQLISLRYGTVPVVRWTGGLADTVADYQAAIARGTGIVFRGYNATALAIALGRAIELYRQPARWREIRLQGMQRDVSWTASARQYADVYEEALTLAAQTKGAAL